MSSAVRVDPAAANEIVVVSGQPPSRWRLKAAHPPRTSWPRCSHRCMPTLPSKGCKLSTLCSVNAARRKGRNCKGEQWQKEPRQQQRPQQLLPPSGLILSTAGKEICTVDGQLHRRIRVPSAVAPREREAATVFPEGASSGVSGPSSKPLRCRLPPPQRAPALPRSPKALRKGPLLQQSPPSGLQSRRISANTAVEGSCRRGLQTP